MSLIRIKNSALPTLMEGFFNREGLDWHDPFQGHSLPPVNIIEKEDQFQIQLSAPGLTKDKFQIQLNQNALTISYLEEGSKKEEEGKFTRREFRNFTFKRSFTLPETIDKEGIVANYEDGILKLALPKKEEAKAQGERWIEIR
jgi:HSP20 family protein